MSSPRVGRLLIVDSEFTGHHLVYIRLLVRAWRQAGGEVVLALAPSVQESAEWRLHLAPAREDFVLGPSVRRNDLRELRHLVQEAAPDLLVLPNGDRLLARMGVPGAPRPNVPVRGLVMADPREEELVKPLRSIKLLSKSLLLHRAGRRDNVTCCWLRAPSEIGRDEMGSVPDPVVLEGLGSTTDASDLLMGLPGRYWFAVVGVVDRWKNPVLIARSLSRLSAEERHRSGLLVCGPVRLDLQAALSSELEALQELGVAVKQLNRLISNEEMNQVVARADAVVLAYSTHATTSTLGKAAALGTQIVAAGSASFCGHAALLQPEALIGSLTVDSLTEHMRAALDRPRPRPRSLAGPDDFARSLLGLRKAAR